MASGARGKVKEKHKEPWPLKGLPPVTPSTPRPSLREDAEAEKIPFKAHPKSPFGWEDGSVGEHTG